ncbi:MAG: tetratricopeptide repeat protein [Myxococcales bacterium]|nr:tetratricopeptide repeat protein [Myxococcales bacterium]
MSTRGFNKLPCGKRRGGGRRRLRWLGVVAATCFLAGSASSATSPRQVADAIIELDVERGKELLKDAEQRSDLAFERARLALYLGDCETAQAILASPQFANVEEARHFREVADGCTGTTVGGLVVEDKERGVWMRLQDSEDKALAPLIAEVADKARARIEQDLGVKMPRPLRIDLVRDLFSLAAVTGLPLEAAETTGTVAVARWGRVTMLSPRAASLGYPWEDTLAHEITHLALSRATRDRAPLWLQEGVAKREETRWREKQPFDDADYDRVARSAQAQGKSVGINGLGSSIAMLPTPESASIAFAEVTSFMGFWLRENGMPAFHLLLRDLKGVGERGPNAALASVTGVSLSEWNSRWQGWLEGNVEAPAPPPKLTPLEVRKRHQQSEDMIRYARLGDLLFDRGHMEAAESRLTKMFDASPDDASLRARLARTALARGDGKRAKELVSRLEDVDSANAHWWALRARFGLGTGAERPGSPEARKAAYRLGVALDPLSEVVACGGFWKARGAPQHSASNPSASPSGGDGGSDEASPTDGELAEAYRSLCEAAQRFGRD